MRRIVIKRKRPFRQITREWRILMESKHSLISRKLISRVVSFTAAAAIAAAMLPFALFRASAQTNTPIYDQKTGLQYTLDYSSGKFTAIIYGYVPEDIDDASADFKVDIPKEISDVKYPVTGIDTQAFNRFSRREKIKSVTIPSTVTTIGDYAFSECTGLETVSLSSGDLVKIGSYAFAGCSALKDISIPEKVTEVGYAAFSGCTSLKTAKFPSSLETLGQSAFSGCSSLEKIELPKGLKTLGASAFDGCSAATEVKLPENITSIEDGLFHNCRAIQSVTIPETVTRIGSNAFSECDALTAINLPDKVTSIGSMAFANDHKLTAINMPYDLSDISDSAFYGSPIEFWGYTGSPAYYYAYQHNITFHESGQVHKVTFSADNMYATVNNIAIRSSDSELIIPPAMVKKGVVLTISVTAPLDYEVGYITINSTAFVNGGTYTVDNDDVDIFVSYIPKAASTTTTTAVTTVSSIPTTTSLITTTTPAVTTSVITTTTTPPPATTTTTTTTTAAAAATTTTSALAAPDVTDEDTTAPSDGSTTGDSYIRVDSDLQDINGVNVRIITQRGNFIGPATVRLTNTAESYLEAGSAAERLDIADPIYYALDISLEDQNGRENPGIMARGSITFQIPVPNELLPYANSIQVYHIVDGVPERLRSSIIEDINDVKRIQFETDSFSPYMFIASTDEDEEISVIDEDGAAGDDTTAPASSTTTTSYIPVDDAGAVIEESDNNDDTTGGNTGDSAGGNTVENIDSVINNVIGNDAQIVDDTRKPATQSYPSYNGNINPHTGAVVAGGTICALTLACIPLVRSRKKRKRSKTTNVS